MQGLVQEYMNSMGHDHALMCGYLYLTMYRFCMVRFAPRRRKSTESEAAGGEGSPIPPSRHSSTVDRHRPSFSIFEKRNSQCFGEDSHAVLILVVYV